MKFNIIALKQHAAFVADKENKDYIVIPHSGAVRPIREGEYALPACLNQNDGTPILVYRNCKYCAENRLSL